MEEIKAITDSYIVKHLSREDVARKFRVTQRLVSDLVCEFRTKPEKMREAKVH